MIAQMMCSAGLTRLFMKPREAAKTESALNS